MGSNLTDPQNKKIKKQRKDWGCSMKALGLTFCSTKKISHYHIKIKQEQKRKTQQQNLDSSQQREPSGQAWWRTPVVSALGKLRPQEGHKVKASCTA